MPTSVQRLWFALIAAAGFIYCGSAIAGRCDSAICVEISSINLGAAPPTIAVSMDPILVGVPPKKIIWKLPEGYVFTSTDGIFVVNHQGEIVNPSAEGDDGEETGVMAKRFKVKVRKALLQQDGYKYTIRFHEMNGGKPTKLVECDPTIANTSGTMRRKNKAEAEPRSQSVQCTVRNDP